MFRNLVRLAESLRPLDPQLSVESALSDFETVMETEIATRWLGRLGLKPNGDTDPALVAAVHEFLDESEVGYDRFFFDLHGSLARAARAMSREADHPYAGPRWNALRAILELYEPSETTVPAYFEGDGPCTLLIDEIESIWSAIAERDDWKPFREKIDKIRVMGGLRST